MLVKRRMPLLVSSAMIWLLSIHTLAAASISSAAGTPVNQKTGIIWKVPPALRPNMELAHPRITYTLEQLQQAKAKLVTGIPWAKLIYDGFQRQADSFAFSDEQIRAFMPPQYSYYKYTDTMVPCPDGSPMTADWSRPGKVTCGGSVYPDATHPDDGRGWRDATGTTHYFVARWNGYVVEQLTASLMPLALTYALNGNEKYAHTAAVILDALATIYPTAIEGPLDYPGLRPGLEGGRLERPYYQTARVLLTYANATDLIWSSKSLDAPSVTNPTLSVRDNITYNLLLNGADYCLREARKSVYVQALSNGVADYNKAILTIGSMFGIDEYVEWAVNGPTSFQTMIANNIDGDGQYYENTSGYTDFVRDLYLQIANIMYNLRTPKYPQGLNFYNDPRFAALYIDARERLFVAGRSPVYGDSASDTLVKISKPFDEIAAKQILQFAIRNDNPAQRASYWELVAEGMSGFTIVSAQSEWGLFNVDAVPAGIQAPTRSMQGTDVLGGKGMTLLRSGNDRGAFLRYGATLTHGQADELGLLLYTNGREMSFDPGYWNAHYRFGWTHQTVSHLATVVNETSQQGSGGSLNFSTGVPGFSVTEALDEGAYAHQGVTVYRRLISLIDATPTNSYVVDIFRVKGGRTRDYSFHSWSRNFTTSGLQLSPPRAGSVASSDYTWHDKIGVDGKVIPYRNESFYWPGPPGNGYGYLGNPKTAAANDVWSATWDNGDRRLKLFMLPAKDREVVVADAPSPMNGAKYLLAREKGDAPSQFVSVVDMTSDKFQIADVKQLPVTNAKPGDFAPVAFAVTLADQSPQVTDIVFSSLTGAFTAQSAGTTYETDGEFASVRIKGTEVQNMRLTKGTFLNTGDMRLEGVPTEYTGKVVSVDYQGGSILVSTPTTLSEGVAGLHALITAPEYSHNSPYQINRIRQEGQYARLYLSPGDFTLGMGSVPDAPYGNRLPNTAPLAYTKIVSRTSPSDYYNGKLVTNDQGVQTLIKSVGSDSTLTVEDTKGFAQYDHLTIYDIKAGDRFSIPVSAHFTKVDDLTYQFASPQAAWLSIPETDTAFVYVTDESGNFVQAKSEMRNGARWFQITPGKVVLQKAGRFDGPTSMTVSDDTRSQIELHLVDLATKSPISQAIVSTTIDGRNLLFQEVNAGVYSAAIPAGIKTGSYDLVILAQKAGLVFYPHTMRIAAQSSWHIKAPERVEAPAGKPFDMEFTLEGLGPASAKILAILGGQELAVEPTNNGGFRVLMPSVTAEQSLTVVVTKEGGFRQEAFVLLQPSGLKMVPLETNLRVKAGQPLVIKVKFVTADGSIVSGEKIPYGMVFYGFITSDTFKDTDGDGIATTTMPSLGDGEKQLTLWADGCDSIDIKAVVEP